MENLRNQNIQLINQNKNNFVSSRSYNALRGYVQFSNSLILQRAINQELLSGINDYSKAKFMKIYPVLKMDNNYVSSFTASIKFFRKINFIYNNINTLKQYYYSVRNAIKRSGGIHSLNMKFKDRNDNKIKGMNISAIYLDNFNDFKEEYERITNPETVGSDAISEDDNDLVLSTFQILRLVVEGNSKSNMNIFKTNNIISNGKCANECLKLCGIETDEILNDFDNLRNYLIKNNLKINIMCNSFNSLKINISDLIFKTKNPKKIEIANKKGRLEKHTVIPLKMDYIVPVYLHKYDEKEYKTAEYTILYDEINSHYDLILNNKIEIDDEVYINSRYEIIKNNQIIFNVNQINKNSKAVAKVNYRYLIFDYETVINFNTDNCMQEYSLSILNIDDILLKELSDANDNNNNDKIQEIRKSNCITFTGFDCSKQFINWLILNSNDIKYTLIGFNNCNFDNYILLDALLKSNKEDIQTSNIFYNGNELLNFCIMGRHTMFDLRKHLSGSLKYNCESFKIGMCSKKTLDHHKMQELFNNNTLLDYIKDNNDLKEYNEYDVISTGILYYKYKSALMNIKSISKYGSELHNKITIGSLIYSVFEDRQKELNIKFDKLELETYNDLQSSKIAGRVEMFNGIQKLNEKLSALDYCSLYPYVMSVLNVYYPYGDIINVDSYKGDDEIGFYYCDIDQSNLKNQNLPNIQAYKTKSENIWDYKEEIKNTLISNVMISLLKKYNCKVVIRNGFIFSNKMKSCEMFNFLLDIMTYKNKEDTLKDSNDKKYNPALRNTTKLLINSLSGKVIEGLHVNKTVVVDNLAKYQTIKDKSKSIDTINTIGENIVVNYTLNKEDIIKEQRPIYIGCLIYDYAKKYMFETVYSKIGLDKLLYTDTDSTTIKYTDFINFKNNNNILVPHWEEIEKIDERYKTHRLFEENSKVFGSLEDELKNIKGDNYTYYLLQKKTYLYTNNNDTKWRFKGINPNNILINNNEEFIIKKNNKYKIDKSKLLEVNNYYNNNNNNSISNNSIKLYDTLYTDKKALILCNQFKKQQENNKLEVVYIVKNIVL
jgi:hypothetical protein